MTKFTFFITMLILNIAAFLLVFALFAHSEKKKDKKDGRCD